MFGSSHTKLKPEKTTRCRLDPGHWRPRLFSSSPWGQYNEAAHTPVIPFSRTSSSVARDMLRPAPAGQAIANQEGPSSFYCPIGLDMMHDPVFLIEVSFLSRSCAQALARSLAPCASCISRIVRRVLSLIIHRYACFDTCRQGTRSRGSISRHIWRSRRGGPCVGSSSRTKH